MQSLALGQLAGCGSLLLALGLLHHRGAAATPPRPRAAQLRQVSTEAPRPSAPAWRAAALDPHTSAALHRVALEQPSSIVTVDAYVEGDDEPVHRRGAGVLASGSGHVFAPLFVVADADSLIVNFGPESRSPARVIAVDMQSQLAVLMLTFAPPHLSYPHLCSAEAEQAETPVVMVTMDSGKTRELQGTVVGPREKAGPLSGVLEVAVHGTPGSLGGALFNARGELVGLALAAGAAQEGGEARDAKVLVLPASQIRRALSRIIKGAPGADTQTERPVSVA